MAVMAGALLTISTSKMTGVVLAIIRLKRIRVQVSDALRSASKMTGVLWRFWLYDWSSYDDSMLDD